MVPWTCANFLGFCEQGQYYGTNFHGLITNLMMQEGKEFAGKPDKSLQSNTFINEFDDWLKHSSQGIVSMENAG